MFDLSKYSDAMSSGYWQRWNDEVQTNIDRDIDQNRKADGAFPLEGAAVSITRRLPDGRSELVSFQRTDSSGNTKPVAIDTPALANSQSPNQPTGFADLDVTADHPLYERVIVDNVQVFPGVTTLQDIQLLPMNVLPESWGQSQEFDVTPQNL